MDLTCRKRVQGYCLPQAKLTVTSARCSCDLHGSRKGWESVMTLPIPHHPSWEHVTLSGQGYHHLHSCWQNSAYLTPMWEGLAGAENTSREFCNCLGALEASAFSMSLVTKGELWSYPKDSIAVKSCSWSMCQAKTNLSITISYQQWLHCRKISFHTPESLKGWLSPPDLEPSTTHFQDYKDWH